MRTVAVLATVLVLGSWQLGRGASVARADAPVGIKIAVPTNVTITAGEHLVVFIGKPSALGNIACAPGTPQAQTVVAVSPAGGGAQITDVIVYHEHEIPKGARYLITSDPSSCTADLNIFTGILK